MRSLSRFACGLVLAAAVALGGCTAGGGIGDPTAPPSSGSGIADQIIAAAQAACKYVPAISMVNQILGNGTVATVTEIATAICNAATTKSARRGAAAPRVYGVPLKGSFLR